MSAQINEFIGEKHVIKLPRKQNINSKLLGRGFESTGHVHIWRQIRSVDFKRWPDGTLDGPAHVQAETHFDGEVSEAFVQLGVEAIACQFYFFILVWVLISYMILTKESKALSAVCPLTREISVNKGW